MKILLVNMPFGPLLTPSLALSTFKPMLENAGHECFVRYSNIEFSQLIGPEIYHLISSGLPRAHDLVGEFIFSRSMFGDAARSCGDFLHYLESTKSSDRKKGNIPSSRDLVANLSASLHSYVDIATSYIEDLAEEIGRADFDVVGLTSAFQQNNATLAVARRLKLLCPNLRIIAGGANFEGEMGEALFSHFQFLDSVVIGEGETVLMSLIHYYGDNGPHPEKGVLSRKTENSKTFMGSSTYSETVTNLNTLPTPDYTDFMKAAESAELPHAPQLLYETSRGCWWGEKHHCTFCGLNGATMAFRSKDSDVALAQIQAITHQYPGVELAMTDNIMDYKYFDNLIPGIASLAGDISLFYEMKSNLSKARVVSLADAGVKNIQPGIESFDDRILSLMKKGVTGLQNVQLLKWCAQFGIIPHWNFLLGFPHEPTEAYDAMALLVPSITHLQPPRGVGRLRIDRFSPYFSKSEGNFSDVRPFEAYTYSYPLADDVLEKIAYFFDGTPNVEGDPKNYTSRVVAAIDQWKENWEEVFLFYVPIRDGALCCDSRHANGRELKIHFLGHVERSIIEKCDRVTSINRLKNELLENFDETDVLKAFKFLVDHRLIILDGERALALAIPAGQKYPGTVVMERLRGIYSEGDQRRSQRASEAITV